MEKKTLPELAAIRTLQLHMTKNVTTLFTKTTKGHKEKRLEGHRTRTWCELVTMAGKATKKERTYKHKKVPKKQKKFLGTSNLS